MHSSPRRWCTVGIVVLCCARANPARAQTECVAGIGTLERRDVPAMTITHRDSSRSLLGDVTHCTDSAGASRSLRPLLPRMRVTGNRGLPAAAEEGELWSGRGVNVALRVGVAADLGILHVVFAPEFVTSANIPFDNEPARDSSLSSFASAFYGARGNSLDLPERFGADRVTRVTPGGSAIFVARYGLAVGVSASPQQWGPGMRGSLLLGAASSGVPRAFLRTATPQRTRFGVFDGALFVGTLTESPYFDRVAANDYRSLSAFGLTWSPDSHGTFTLGAARAVMRAMAGSRPSPSRTFDPLRRADSTAESMVSLFARVGAPTDPLSAWMEVARNRPGFGLRSFLTLPYDAVGYIVGTRGTATLARGRIEALLEAANVEQSEDVIGRAPRDFYSGSAVPQGWTERGRTLGDWIGPGGQSQFVAVDWVLSRARAGLFAERVRRNEDALFREYLPYPNRHDVSLALGTRGAVLWHGYEIGVEASIGKRRNYEFRNAEYLPAIRTVDVATPRLRVSFIPQSQR